MTEPNKTAYLSAAQQRNLLGQVQEDFCERLHLIKEAADELMRQTTLIAAEPAQQAGCEHAELICSGCKMVHFAIRQAEPSPTSSRQTVAQKIVELFGSFARPKDATNLSAFDRVLLAVDEWAEASALGTKEE